MRVLRLLLLTVLILAIPAVTFAQFSLSITLAPPALPVYVQPEVPGDGYIWTPGYWAYGQDGYFWVPGTWVEAPEPGFLWTPGYWGWNNNAYVWNGGYWGEHVGFYGGVNYGFGYVGVGFAGGRWDGGHFAYNTAVNNVNVTVIHNTYNQTVINNNVTVNNRVSFNGGAGGIQAAPTAQERAAAQEPHTPPTPMQVQHRQQAAQNPALSAKNNGGHPAIAATPKPGAFSGPGVVGARNAPAAMNRESPGNFGNAAHPPANATPHANTVPHANTAPPPAQAPKPAIKQQTKPQAPKPQQQKHPQEPRKEGERPH
jgi:hypothetical protein